VDALAQRIVDLLAQSRAAHERYRANVPRKANVNGRVVVVPGDAVAARAALQEALELRRQAVDVDPEFTSDGWDSEPGTHDHDALMVFYQSELATLDGRATAGNG